jgi:hypothetical protein
MNACNHLSQGALLSLDKSHEDDLGRILQGSAQLRKAVLHYNSGVGYYQCRPRQEGEFRIMWRRKNSSYCLYEDSKLRREGLEYRKKDRFI